MRGMSQIHREAVHELRIVSDLFQSCETVSTGAAMSYELLDQRGFRDKPTRGLEPLTPSLPWRCSTS